MPKHSTEEAVSEPLLPSTRTTNEIYLLKPTIQLKERPVSTMILRKFMEAETKRRIS
jgi:hypothetical protein